MKSYRKWVLITLLLCISNSLFAQWPSEGLVGYWTFNKTLKDEITGNCAVPIEKTSDWHPEWCHFSFSSGEGSSGIYSNIPLKISPITLSHDFTISFIYNANESDGMLFYNPNFGIGLDQRIIILSKESQASFPLKEPYRGSSLVILRKENDTLEFFEIREDGINQHKEVLNIDEDVVIEQLFLMGV